MKIKVVLQRLRFWDTELRQDPSDKGWRRSIWDKKGRDTYWSCDDPEVLQNFAYLKFKAGQSISSDSFFNAFYLAHWRRLTSIRTLFLNLQFQGKASLEVFLHTASSTKTLLEARDLNLKDGQEASVPLFLDTIPHGLRLSFTLTAHEDFESKFSGEWATQDHSPFKFNLAIGIATYNRQDFAERLIRKILDDPTLQKEAVFIYLVDQSDNVRLEHLNGPRCRVIRQDNLGCSGGMSRAIYESVFASTQEPYTHVLLMDDDSELESDSILRAIRIAQYAKEPILLGGTMLDLYRPNLAGTFGDTYRRDALEQYDKYYWIDSHLPITDVTDDCSKGAISIPTMANWAGWWFCLMPVEAIRKMGLPAPLFLKVDDMEYGIRSQRNGYPTFTIPGIGLWHVPFYSKSAPWLQYFETHNSLILNCLYEFESLQDAFHFSCTTILDFISEHRYQHAAASLRGLEDFTGGWLRFKERRFPEYLDKLRALVGSFDLNEKIPKPNADQIHILKTKLEAILLRFNMDGASIHRDFNNKFCRSYTLESWGHYFEHGNFDIAS